MHKRLFKGTAVIICSMIAAILCTIIYGNLIKKFPESECRLSIIFGVGSFVIGMAAICTAVAIYTNNFGEGFKN